ncbi:MAG: WYL domain-containing protein, partial [Hyphomicrobiales bacterium]|nr:WYL domain-containing protein [Hyphomicrobiales bacterium]
LALQVYQDLGRYLRLPTRTPQTLKDRLAQLATPADFAAADVAAEQTLAALRQALEGATPFPAWPEDHLPEAKSLAAIETAMSTGQNVRLLYYTAGTDRLTRRVVEPYRVQWHGGGEAEEQGSKGAVEQGSRGAGEQGSVTLVTDAVISPRHPCPPAPLPNSGTPYLIGFCHHAQAERMFRLDRIRDIEIVPPDDVSPAGYEDPRGDGGHI